MKLQYPIKVIGSSTSVMPDSAPQSEIVHLTYPERKKQKDINIDLPEVEVSWFDGGLKPKYPENWPVERNQQSGVLFHGTKDILVCGEYGTDPILLSGRVPDIPKTLRRIEVIHEQDWIRACKESPESRVLSASDFSVSGPFNEMVVMGVLAVRLQALNKVLYWDGPNMNFTNVTDNDKLRLSKTDSASAKEFAAELIKHTYQNGFTLPDMPV